LNRHICAALIAVAALAPAGCCSLARMACSFPVPKSPAKGDRSTPDAAVDFLVDAFRRRATLDVYESFHRAFIEENGGFHADEFATAYHHFEADFAANAESLADAERKVVEESQDRVVIELTNAKTGAFLPIVFEDRPKFLLVTKDPLADRIPASIDMRALVRLEDGRLSLPANITLTTIEGVSPEMVAGLKSSDVLRVEFFHDWLVRSIDPARAKNIHFMDKIKEHLPQ
jgi:hypothetical protein